MKLSKVLKNLAFSLMAVVALTGFLCARPAAGNGSASSSVAADSGQRLYVADQNAAAVSVIDMSTNTVIYTVDLEALGFSATAKPHHVVVEPDGSYWYVSLIAEDRVLKFDRENILVGQVAFERPGLMALDPSTNRLYVGRSMAAVNPPQRIGIINRVDMSLDEVDVFFPRPHAIAVGPGGHYLYSASLALNQMAGYDTESEQLELLTVDGPTHTIVQFALTPDGRTLVATGQLTGDLLIFDVTDFAEIEQIGTVKVGRQPWHPVITPDGRYVYLGNKDDNSVSVVDLTTQVVVATITGNGLAQPHGSAVSADGKFVYISNRNLNGAYTPAGYDGEGEPVGTVVVIATETNSIIDVIEVDRYPAGLGTPAGVSP